MKRQEPETRSLENVLVEMTRQHTVAVICAHLIEYTASSFRGGEGRGPSKLLRTPDGSARRADVDDVLVVEQMLASVVEEARGVMARLQRARFSDIASDRPTPRTDASVLGDVVEERRAPADANRRRRP